MKKGRYTEEQIAYALKQAELGTTVPEICRKLGIAEQTFYRWRKKYGGMPSVNPKMRGFRDRNDIERAASTHCGVAPGRATRNKRTVWTVATQPFSGAHFAVFPPKLIEPMVLAGSAEGDTVLDPFAGSGTTGMVALRHGRSFIGCELNREYVELARRRIVDDAPLLNQMAEVVPGV